MNVTKFKPIDTNHFILFRSYGFIYWPIIAQGEKLTLN